MNDVADSSGPAAPFASMPELQREYLTLVEADDALERAVEDPQGGGVDAFRDTVLLRRRIRHFERRTAATGTILDNAADRALATSMLDFWGIRQAYLRRYSDQLRPLKPDRQNLPAATPRLGGSISLQPFDEMSAPELPDNPSPFVGLNAFGEREARESIFCGREAAVAELRTLLSERRLALVTGPSGSGKSSLIMAGLVPALQAGAIPGSEKWRYWPPVLPGADPFAALLQSLHSGGGDPARWVADHRTGLEKDPSKVVDLLSQIGEGGPSLLIVDQMEEMLSMVADKTLQEKFAAAIVAPSQVATPDHHVILVIREDFLPRLLKLAPFSNMSDLAVAPFRPKPMSSAELRQAIEDPARAVGLKFDEGIVEDLVREVVNDPAALPLLQFALAQLWQRRRRNRITREAYAEIGRPADALGRTAEQVYENLRTEQAHAAARDIFLALVVPAVGAEFVRRRVRRETLHALRDSTQIDRVLEDFVAAGLIRMSPGVETGDDRFDVMHEALLRNWPRLIAWLKEIRDKDERKLLMLNRARIWEQSGREPDHLAVGAAIAETAEFAAADPLILQFVEASRAQAKAQERRRKIRVGAVLFGIAALIVVGLATINYIRSKNSEELNSAIGAYSNELKGVQQSTVEVQEGTVNLIAGENLLLTTRQLAPRKVADGAGVDGLIRVGLAGQTYLRSGDAVIPLADVLPDRLYRLRVNTPLVSYSVAGGKPATPVRLIGSASAGAVVLSLGNVTFVDRPTGRQYWLQVRVIPRVFLQYSGRSEREVGLFRDQLRERGYDVPLSQQIDSPRGRAEIRYYFSQDANQAAALKRTVEAALAAQISRPPPVTLRFLPGRPKARQGYLEIWLGAPPADQGCAPGQSTAGCAPADADGREQVVREQQRIPVSTRPPAQAQDSEQRVQSSK